MKSKASFSKETLSGLKTKLWEINFLEMKTLFLICNYITSCQRAIHNISANISQSMGLVDARKNDAQSIVANVEVIFDEDLSNQNLGTREQILDMASSIMRIDAYLEEGSRYQAILT